MSSEPDFATTQERDQFLARLASTKDLRAHEVLWMLFRPDRWRFSTQQRDAAATAGEDAGGPQ